ncbi:TetR/AcrR family transcriptional regulator [Erysipelothrix sp. HDW6C]|uniref:TetR/AcrR family transcriptional regulator n=1 Tax=Erysipelothrix sp. HDW6C TaxID=2714930 RepID=UPI00140D253C|nr:TetR/AcrR family transcriptional regulator [Erysipelothrix sp. HDW6C]QIK70466.1 TetR/AcrR family transcriptional regulator [Erysipelothrix sp. HDW6C]
MTNDTFAKQCITDALLILVETKPFNSISITELCDRAGVSRMTYYRHYETKEDILVTRLNHIFNDFITTVRSAPSADNREILQQFAALCRREHVILNAMIHSELTPLLQTQISSYFDIFFAEIIHPHAIEPTVGTYSKAFIIGGLIQVVITWIERSMFESDTFIAETLYTLVRGAI